MFEKAVWPPPLAQPFRRRPSLHESARVDALRPPQSSLRGISILALYPSTQSSVPLPLSVPLSGIRS